MPGQLIKRGDNTWLVRLPLGRDAQGKRIYHNRTIKGSKKDAERYRTKTLREMDTSTFVEASQQLVAEYLTSWLDHVVATRVRRRTLDDYRALARKHLVPVLGHRKLAQLTPHDIQKAYAGMEAKGLSARSVRYTHSVLHSALDEAVRWRLLASNPAKLVTLPRQERREMRSLTSDDVRRFIASARGTRFEALWLLLHATGYDQERRSA